MTKIDWTTWTKGAMARTIEELNARQLVLLNRIAELERERDASPFRVELRFSGGETAPHPALDWSKLP